MLPSLTVAGKAPRQANRLKIPKILVGDSRSGRKKFHLQVRNGVSQFLPGLVTPSCGINGSFLGPTLRFNNGEKIAMHVENQLPFEPTTLHWHGLYVPAAADGGPHNVIEPGDTWQREFRVQQRASTLWYHSHLMGKAGEQVNKGLAALIIIDDEECARTNLPSNYGVDDIPLIVQDRRFNEDG